MLLYLEMTRTQHSSQGISPNSVILCQCAIFHLKFPPVPVCTEELLQPELMSYIIITA